MSRDAALALDAADPLARLRDQFALPGGIAALRAKSLALSEAFIAGVESRCGGLGLSLVSPRDGAARGSQVCLTLSDPLSPAADGYAVMQALATRGVIGDFRAGSAAGVSGAGPELASPVLRFGIAPLYNRYVDIWDAVEALRQVLAGREWREARFRKRAAVT